MQQRHRSLDQTLIKLLPLVLGIGPQVFEDLVAFEKILGVEKPQAFQILCRIFVGHWSNVTVPTVACP